MFPWENDRKSHVYVSDGGTSCTYWSRKTSLCVSTILLSQTGDELLRRNDSDFLLLRGDAVEQVGQTGEERLLAAWLHLEWGSGQMSVNTLACRNMPQIQNVSIRHTFQVYFEVISCHTRLQQALGSLKNSFSDTSWSSDAATPLILSFCHFYTLCRGSCET